MKQQYFYMPATINWEFLRTIIKWETLLLIKKKNAHTTSNAIILKMVTFRTSQNIKFLCEKSRRFDCIINEIDTLVLKTDASYHL